MSNKVIEKTVNFSCEGDILQGILHEVENATYACIMVVGGPQTRIGSHRMFVEIARDLAKRGITVLRFDYRGAGDSEGAIQSFEDTVDDIEAALIFLRQVKPNITAINLWGLCDAASAIAIHLVKYPNNKLDNIILLNPWVKQASTEAKAILNYYYWQRLVDTSFWKKLLSGKFNPLKSSSDLLAHKKEAAKQSNVSFVEKMYTGLMNFKGNKHVILSSSDLTAQEFIELRANSKPWKTLQFQSEVIIEGANHTFASPNWKQQVQSHTYNAIISS